MLNYTQGKQLNLLKNIGFTAPSWHDLSYVLIGIIVLVSLVGAAWGLWERTQHDPWIRLLGRARRRLAQAGIASTAATSPRQLAQQLQSRFGDAHAAVLQWLLQLEAQRYSTAPGGGAGDGAHQALRQLQQQFKSLQWPK